MKNLLCLAFFTSVNIIFSQSEYRVGLKAGLNLSSFTGVGFENTESFTGYHAGFAFEFPVSHTVSFQPELLYSKQGAKYSFASDILEATGIVFVQKDVLEYISAPLVFKVYIVDRIHLEFGPQLAFLKSAIRNFEVGTKNDIKQISVENGGVVTDQFHRYDLGFGFGMGYLFERGMTVGFRYTSGLVNINKANKIQLIGEELVIEDQIKNAILQLSVGLLF